LRFRETRLASRSLRSSSTVHVAWLMKGSQQFIQRTKQSVCEWSTLQAIVSHEKVFRRLGIKRWKKCVFSSGVDAERYFWRVDDCSGGTEPNAISCLHSSRTRSRSLLSLFSDHCFVEIERFVDW
jgi:hypothetical protein